MFSHMWAGTQAGFSHRSAGRERLCKGSSKHRERSFLFPLKPSVCTCSIPCWSQDIRMRMFYSVNHIIGQSTFHTESFFNIMFPNQTFVYNLLKDNSPKRVEWVTCLCWPPLSVLFTSRCAVRTALRSIGCIVTLSISKTGRTLAFRIAWVMETVIAFPEYRISLSITPVLLFHFHRISGRKILLSISMDGKIWSNC